MAIVRFDFDKAVDGFQSHYNLRTPEPWAEGAYAPLGSDNTKKLIHERGALILWETHKGLCVSEREMNGSSDSDFFMTVWDEENQCAKEIMFATTRGWSYPSMASYVDASEEIRQKVKAYGEEQIQKITQKQRHEKAKILKKERAEYRKLAEEHQFPSFRLCKLIRKSGDDNGKAILKLLKSNLRSQFRMSLRERLVSWLQDNAPAYQSPFSHKQWEYL